MKYKLLSFLFALLAFVFAGNSVFALGAQDTSLKNARKVLGSETVEQTQPVQQNQPAANPTQNTSQQTANNSNKITATSVINTVLGSVAGNAGNLSFSNQDAVDALKNALNIGAETASKELNKTDAYYRNPLYYIPMPEEAAKLVATVEKLPNGKKTVENVIIRLNRTAEACAAGIVPIFVEAISGMSVNDGISIVTGEQNAATNFLKDKTYNQLKALYKPQISAALDQNLVGNMSANDAWNKLVSLYNKTGTGANKIGSIFGKDEVMDTIDTDLAEYATDKALNAIFMKIADEEKSIRKNPMEYGSNIIQKVFGAVKNQN
ncbi:MAG: DUF4197 domain-containing protein [Treponemataceae bacterium]|nr:DUF4197 domain-containing protein [Treponemataceae bacterium]